MTTSWFSRDQYGNIVKNLIKTQYKSFTKTKDSQRKLKLSQNVAYLIQIENSLINDRHNSIKSDLDFYAHLEIITPEPLRKEIDKIFDRFRTDKEDSKTEKKYKENKKKDTIRSFIKNRDAKKSNSRGQKERDRRVLWEKENDRQS